MKNTAILILSGVLAGACGAAQAQSSSGASTQANEQTKAQANGEGSANGVAVLPGGTTINATLNNSLDSKKVKEGDTVTVHTTADVKENGRTVLPRGTKLIGRVTHSSARSRGDADSTLAIQFDKAELKHGAEVPLNASICALAAPQQAPAYLPQDENMGAMGGETPSNTSGIGPGAQRSPMGNPVDTAPPNAVTSTIPNTANVGGAANGTVNAAEQGSAGRVGDTHAPVGGLNNRGELTSNSRGVFGLHGLQLRLAAANSTNGSVISSSGKNVKLEGGTKLLLMTEPEPAAAAAKP